LPTHLLIELFQLTHRPYCSLQADPLEGGLLTIDSMALLNEANRLEHVCNII